MSDTDARVSEHYGRGGLGPRILTALEAAGKDLDNLTPEDLAPIDAFHIRGRGATEELASWVGPAAGERVLDVGCGIGGTARFLATTFGCEVVGLDLTDEYCRVAEMLSMRVGLANRTAFRQGSALDLPFEDGSFDTVWTEHVQMNIADKPRFYGELVRVLKPGGKLAFHDIFAGEEDGLDFPVPWAAEPSISHLIRVDELGRLIDELKLKRMRWEDRTEASLAFFRTVLAPDRAEGLRRLGLQVVIGDDAHAKFSNMLRNLEAGRLQVMQAVLSRPA